MSSFPTASAARPIIVLFKIGVNINQIARKVNTTGDLYPEEMKRIERDGERTMAYIKIFPIKVTDKKALDYITNPDKTDEKLLVSSFGCSPETADLEFAMTREHAKRTEWIKAITWHFI